nr:immunoglobulin heavy chain junction region [Mus musculus]NSM04277.1 immunoglobulin heavy chain junction region [Mus musculus]NSM06007.1 immunoglobulin heavy chain junction region [Mus musculus]NSM06061.1 immunoglobulin heavy chain junction region [Mus musculus]NSM06228.1 immunoglobulin heavy chain junction region [Mus musculus]
CARVKSGHYGDYW